MSGEWDAAARRAAAGLGVEAGELILVRDRAGRRDVFEAMLLAVEERGATPLPELVTTAYLRGLMARTPVEHLKTWDRHRLGWMNQIDRMLVLEGMPIALADVPEAALAAWRRAVGRIVAADDARRLPFMLVAVPTPERAASVGLPLDELEAMLLPALAVEAETLRAEIERTLGLIGDARQLTIRTGDDCELHLVLGNRAWLDDAGAIRPGDRERGAHVANLPAGSVYTTVLEGETHGRIHIGLENVILRFEAGSVVEIDGGEQAEAMRAMLDHHGAGARRISHIGIGLNPALRRFIGWTLVDEHVHGAIFLALGENRYLGGENESTLNVDYALPAATLLADDRVVVNNGILAEPGS